MDRFEFKHGGMTTDAAGRWVTYNDHLLEMEHLREEVRKQTVLIQALRDERGREFVLRSAQSAAEGSFAGATLARLQLQDRKL